MKKQQKLDFSVIQDLLTSDFYDKKPFIINEKGEKIKLFYSDYDYGEYRTDIVASIYTFKEIAKADKDFIKLDCDLEYYNDITIHDLQKIESQINENEKSQNEIFAEMENLLKKRDIEFIYFCIMEHGNYAVKKCEKEQAHGILFMEKKRKEQYSEFKGVNVLENASLNYLQEYLNSDRVDIFVYDENNEIDYIEPDVSIFEVAEMLVNNFYVNENLEFHHTTPFYKKAN